MKIDSLFAKFPYIETDTIIVRKVETDEFDDWYAIISNKNLYKYTPVRENISRNAAYNLLSKHIERDFNKRKIIFLGIYLKNESNKLVGEMEIFDVNSKLNMITIGYKLDDTYWGKGIATKSVDALIQYLFEEIEVNRIQAYVMPQNVKSGAVLLRNYFIKEGTIRQGNYWKGQGIIDLDLYSLLKSEYKNVPDQVR